MNQKPPTTEEIVAKNSFTLALGELRKGNAVSDLSAEMARVVQAVTETGKPGELNLKLIIRPNKDGETVSITDKIAPKIPKPDTKATNFFTGEDGQLTRDNPRQPDIFATIQGGVSVVASEGAAKIAANG